MRRLEALLYLLFITLTLAAPVNVFACSICYGAIEGSMTQGLRWAVLTLLLVVIFVLVAFGWFFVNLAKKEKREGV